MKIQIINSIGAVFCLLLGVTGLFSPNSTANFVGIIAGKERGKSEIRATYGGVFIGIGASALFFRDANVFTAVGIGWAFAAIARIFGMVIDKEFHKLNFGGVIFESLVAVLLLWR
jgi:Domain of unknown function (DUF4345)